MVKINPHGAYLVLTGNEFGMSIDCHTATKLLDSEEAIRLYDKYVRDYGNAALFEVTEFALIPVTSETDFDEMEDED